ncbi:MAG: hypothetical protein LUE13_07370 [Akkermansiaceae bacterium]|nr:hypothetical protein [Akkermansiaceae bacterium]
METTPPLPSGFNVNGYLIQSLKQTDPLCHVYFAADSSHVQYLVREFCPQGLAVRDPESGKLRYPESTDIEQEVIPLKNDFEAQFRTGALAEIPAQGTLYLVYALPGAHPAAGTEEPQAQPISLQRDQRALATPGAGAPISPAAIPQPRRKKSSLGIWILLLVLLGGGYGAYYYSTHSRSEEAAPAQEPAKPQEKRKAPKPEAGNKAAQPAPETGDPFERETAAAEEQPPQEPSPAAEQPAEDKADAPEAAGDEETVPEPAAEEPETASAETDDADDAKEAAPVEKENPSPSSASAAAPSRNAPAAATAPAGRSRATAHRQTTNMGGRERVHQEIRQGASPEPVEETVFPAVHKLVRQQGRDSRRLDHHLRPPRVPRPGAGYVLAQSQFQGHVPQVPAGPQRRPRGERVRGHPGDRRLPR